MIKFAFFGSSEFSIRVLDAMAARGFLPAAVVTMPDKPRGRGLKLASNIVKEWAQKKNIPMLDPGKPDDAFIESLKRFDCEVSIVASYGKIIPDKALDAAPKKTLNVHPSLLPNYRGASPIQSAILDDQKKTGVTIIRLDKEMDHGPIVGRAEVHFKEWSSYEKVEADLGSVGGELMAKVLPEWVAGKIVEEEQDHAAATFTKKIIKEDGLLDLGDLAKDAPTAKAYLAFRKIQAYHAWPGAYFFLKKDEKEIRVKITSASWKDGRLDIEKVIPEGKKETRWADFARSASLP